jgi:hypothetical protein
MADVCCIFSGCGACAWPGGTDSECSISGGDECVFLLGGEAQLTDVQRDALAQKVATATKNKETS